MIKEIHCFGTSHTEGGGFEFMHKEKGIELKKFYNEQFELLKNSVGGDYKYSFTKDKLNNYLDKQKIEDLNHVGILSTRNFIANTQETEKKYLPVTMYIVHYTSFLMSLLPNINKFEHF